MAPGVLILPVQPLEAQIPYLAAGETLDEMIPRATKRSRSQLEASLKLSDPSQGSLTAQELENLPPSSKRPALAPVGSGARRVPPSPRAGPPSAKHSRKESRDLTLTLIPASEQTPASPTPAAAGGAKTDEPSASADPRSTAGDSQDLTADQRQESTFVNDMNQALLQSVLDRLDKQETLLHETTAELTATKAELTATKAEVTDTKAKLGVVCRSDQWYRKRDSLASILSRDTRAVTLHSLCEIFVRSVANSGQPQDTAAASIVARDFSRRSMDIVKSMSIHAQQEPTSAAGWIGHRFQEGIQSRHVGAHIGDIQTVITRLALEMHDLSQQSLAAVADVPSRAWDNETPRQAYYRLLKCSKLAKEVTGEEQWPAYQHTASLDPSLPLPWERPEARPL